MGNHHAVATLHLATEDALTSIFLRVEDDGRTFEVPQTLIDTSGLYDTTVLSDVAKEHSESAILRIGMIKVADTTIGAISIE